MSLNSFGFILFFAITIVCMSFFQLLRKRFKNIKNIQLVFLLGISYIYIYNWKFCVCLMIVTIISYVCSIMISQTKHKIWLIAGICFLCCFLGYFKYLNFFVNSFRSIFRFSSFALDIILPIGISFYIFSAMAYLIDVYRGEYPVEKNVIVLALYLAFFPKLTAGPIIRGKDFFPQVHNYRGIEWGAFKVGIQIFIFGLFKKIVLADHLGVFVDDVFYVPNAYDTGTVILAAISYSLQIYYDFSGYSDMAIGVSKILGFDFKPNFNLPYIAQNVSEFWKRWHISLSSWFQDYLYIPLGGSRKGTTKTYINLMIVMLVSGLWHGAGWTFIVWGATHGIASCVNKAVGKKINSLGAWLNCIFTFIFVTLAWVIFRSDSIITAVKVWTRMFTIHSGISQPYTWSFFAIACLVISTIVAVIRRKKKVFSDKTSNLVINGYYPVLDLSKIRNQVIFFTFCGLTIIMGYFGNTAFIYGAF